MATNKTFSVAGVSTLNGVTKVRFANDFVSRIKILAKNGHEDVILVELDEAVSKMDACSVLMQHPAMQGETAQGAVAEWVVRNTPKVPKPRKAKATVTAKKPAAKKPAAKKAKQAAEPVAA